MLALTLHLLASCAYLAAAGLALRARGEVLPAHPRAPFLAALVAVDLHAIGYALRTWNESGPELHFFAALSLVALGMGVLTLADSLLRRVSALYVVMMPIAALAQESPAPPPMDKADTVWLIVSSALVLLMVPGLALFYGGMVRRQNVLSTMLHSFVLMGTITVLWFALGYTLAFGPSTGWIGGLDNAMGNGVSMLEVASGLTIPQGVFLLFQMMFAIITPALISGAIAERMRFGAYLLFTALWSLLVYAPVACWVWNAEGWLFKLGALDFAGGTVVHLASGVAALAACLALGPRRVVQHKEPVMPNNLTLTLLGAGLLWFGWFGFNSGSAYAVNDIAVRAFLTTQLAAGAGLLGWLLLEKMRYGKATALGAASGLVAGLVGITPGAGFVEPGSALLIGFLA
ncbi:MAG TPA: ammonium transporter, partial [Hyphomonas sp.]|nr:ammonium transporter [Hyphomonas sp.]